MVQQFHFWVYTSQTETNVLKSHLYTHIHCSIICKSKELEVTQVSNEEQIDKENETYTYNGI